MEEPRINQEDLYHRLGKLEGLLLAAQQNITGFQESVRGVHNRLDVLEKRQGELEKSSATDKGTRVAIGDGTRDFLIPIVALMITYYVARSAGGGDGGACPNPSRAAAMMMTPVFDELVIQRSI